VLVRAFRGHNGVASTIFRPTVQVLFSQLLIASSDVMGPNCSRRQTTGQSVSKIDLSVLWGPTVLGRNEFERRWAYGVEAPFDTNGDIPELIRTRVHLDGRMFEIRGIVAAASNAPIREGQVIELLVLAL
jgi:hypothetical protein